MQGSKILKNFLLSSVLLIVSADVVFTQIAEDADRLFYDGKKLYQNGMFEQASEQFKAAGEIDERLGPDRKLDLGYDYYWMGLCYENLGRDEKALEYYTRSLEIGEQLGQKDEIANSLTRIGRVYDSLGRYEEALEYYERALILSEELGRRDDTTILLSNIGQLHYSWGRYAGALEHYRRALAITEKWGNRADTAILLNYIGRVYQSWSRYEDALEYYKRALSIDEELGREEEISTRLNNIGLVYFYLGRYADALEQYRRALAISKELGDRVNTATVVNNIGLVYQSQGRYEDALEYYERALAISEELGDKAKTATVLNNIGIVHNSRGRYEDALEYYRRALAILKETRDKANTAIFLNNVGEAYFSLGRYEEAIEHFGRALAISEELGDRANAATVLNNTGLVYQSWGRYEDALDFFTRALALSEELGARAKTVSALNNIGSVYEPWGRYEDALEYFRRALALSEELGDRANTTKMLNNIGLVYQSLGRHEEALEYYERVLAMSEQLGQKSDMLSGFNNIGIVYESLGRYEEALACYTRSLEIGEQLGRKEDVAQCLSNIGTLYKVFKKYAEAAQFYNRSITILEQLRLTAPGAIRRDYLASQIKKYQRLISTFIHDNKPIRAFNTAELSSAKYLIEQMSERLDETTLQFTSIDAYQSKIPKDSSILNYTNVNWSETVSRLYADADEIFAEEKPLKSFVAGIKAKYEKRIAFALKNLDKGRRGGKTEQIGFDQIINYYRFLLSKTELRNAEKDAMSHIGRALYDLLFSGLEEQLADREALLIIPGGILALLPFEALIIPDGRYLVERFHVRYAQSLTVSEILEKRRYGAKERRPLLALGGAVYQGGAYDETIIESEKQLEALRETTEVALTRGLEVKDAYRRLGYGEWDNLPGTLTEVRRIGEIVPGAKVLTGREVDEAHLKELSEQEELKRYRIIHFATHGIVVPEMPELSALVLAQLEEREDQEDGYLRTGEVARLNLEADFVNLSACETGLGKIYGGEGVVGLTQSFLVAGANGLSVSLWRVSDKSTMEFMVEMYRLVNEKGMSYGRAITEIKRRFIKGRYSAPFYWAPFVYYGK